MHHFTQNGKLFFKNKLLLSGTLLTIILPTLYLCYKLIYYNSIFPTASDRSMFSSYLLIDTLELPLFLFALFALLSYEAFRAIRHAHAQEILAITRHGLSSFYIDIGLLFLLFSIILSVFILIENVVYFACIHLLNRETFLYLFLHILLNIFLVSSLGIITGLLFSVNQGKFSGYIGILVCILLISPATETLNQIIFQGTGLKAYYLTALFQVCSPNLKFTSNMLLGYPILPYRFAVVLFWIFLLFGIFMLRLHKVRQIKRSRSIAGASLLCALIGLVVLALPSSKSEINFSPNGASFHDIFYYSNEKELVTEEKAAFHILSYRLQFSIARELSAEATIELDRSDLEEYPLTLYHGYRVKKVLDQNQNALSFDRKGDALIVHGSGNCSAITILYHGSSPQFYSNYQGTALPGYLAYYPLPGCLSLYDMENQSLRTDLVKEEADFHLTVRSPRKIYCNLPETSEGTFEGRSNCVTLLSGFLKEKEIDGIRIVYPYLDLSCTEENITAIFDAIQKIEASNPDIPYRITGKKVMVLPNVNQHIGTVFEDDHILVTFGPWGLDQDYNSFLNGVQPEG